MNAPDLHVHSTYSTYDGLGTPKATVERAKELGWPGVVLTEHGWCGSAPPFYKAARAAGINPIIGCEFYVVPDELLGVQDKDARSASFHLTVLALSREGYFNLVQWISFANRQENFYYKPRISPEVMAEIAPYPLYHNVVLSGCLGSELCQSLLHSNGNGVEAGMSYVDAMRDLFPNFYIELQNHYHWKFYGKEQYTAYNRMVDEEAIVRAGLLEISKITDTPCVITNDAHFQAPDQRKAHMHLKAANFRHRDDTHMGTSEATRADQFIADYVYWTSYMRPLEEIADEIDDGELHLENNFAIAEEANIKLDPLDNFKYSIPFSGYDDPYNEIVHRAKPRLKKLVTLYGEMARERFYYELDAMGDFAHYLLLLAKWLERAHAQGILTWTRGSAANSIVCYCLEIHEIDSIRYKLTFERFVNPARKKAPDIDIDIEKERYEDFMRIVHEDMEKLEGKNQCIPICNYGTLANRSAFKKMASALGMSPEQQEELSKLLPQMIDSGMVKKDSDAYASVEHEFPELYPLVEKVFDSISQVGQHPCGWLLGTKDKPVEKWVPKFWIASSKTPVTAYNMKALEDMGWLKLDALRLDTITVIKKTLILAGKNPLDWNSIPVDDPDTFEMLREGRTEGIHSLQGKTQRRGCIEAEVKTIDDVVAVQALYRPSGTRTGFTKVYNARRRGEEEVTYPHEVVEKILGDTFGLPIYQEQVMEIGQAIGMDNEQVAKMYDAIKAAKGVGREAKEKFELIEPDFFDLAMQLMSEQEAQEIWELFDAFQGYGFNRGHATSYALLAVREAYCKANHPQEFFAALLDVFSKRSRYLAAARAEGFRLLEPDVNASAVGFSRGNQPNTIRVGLGSIDGLGSVAARTIVEGAPYHSLDDFLALPASKVKENQREALGRIGALNSLGIKGDGKLETQVELLGFCINEPDVFDGIEPKHVARWESNGHQHLGYYEGLEITPDRATVSKLFWVPPMEGKKAYDLKASPWALVKTNLLLVVDENGIPFQFMANEDKREETAFLDFLYEHGAGTVVCVRGAIRQPFDPDGPMGFRFSDFTGCKEEDPQFWNYDEEGMTTKEFKKKLIQLHANLRAAKRARYA